MDGCPQPSRDRGYIDKPVCSLSRSANGSLHRLRVRFKHRAPDRDEIVGSLLSTSRILHYPSVLNGQEMGWNHSRDGHRTDLPGDAQRCEQLFAPYYRLGHSKRSGLRPLPAAFRRQPSRPIEKTPCPRRYVGKPCNGSYWLVLQAVGVPSLAVIWAVALIGDTLVGAAGAFLGAIIV